MRIDDANGIEVTFSEGASKLVNKFQRLKDEYTLKTDNTLDFENLDSLISSACGTDSFGSINYLHNYNQTKALKFQSCSEGQIGGDIVEVISSNRQNIDSSSVVGSWNISIIGEKRLMILSLNDGIEGYERFEEDDKVVFAEHNENVIRGYFNAAGGVNTFSGYNLEAIVDIQSVIKNN